MIWLTLLVLLCLMPAPGQAAPQISGTTGTATHGSTMTITGSGFGTGDTTPLVWDDFEDGAAGQNLASSPKVGSWALNSQPTPQYTSAYARSGTKASYGSKSAGGGDIFTSVHVPGGSGGLTDKYYYASWWGYYHANCSAMGQIKLIQFWGTYQKGDYNPGFFHGPGSSTYIALENSGTTAMDWPSETKRDAWVQYQLVLKQSDVNVANGIVRIYRDGALIYNQTNVKTREINGQYWQKLIPHEGMTNQSGCADTRFFSMDDLYMNNSWARVVLGNSSTYATSTTFDIQPADWIIPQWSSTSVRVKFNQGNYKTGQTAYLYVVDAAGTFNSNGFPITINGGSGGGTTTLPPPPQNVQVR